MAAILDRLRGLRPGCSWVDLNYVARGKEASIKFARNEDRDALISFERSRFHGTWAFDPKIPNTLSMTFHCRGDESRMKTTQVQVSGESLKGHDGQVEVEIKMWPETDRSTRRRVGFSEDPHA